MSTELFSWPADWMRKSRINKIIIVCQWKNTSIDHLLKETEQKIKFQLIINLELPVLIAMKNKNFFF